MNTSTMKHTMFLHNVHTIWNAKYNSEMKSRWLVMVTVAITGFLPKCNKKASIHWQNSAPTISGYCPTSEPNAG